MTASAQLDVTLPGFADPVEQAQATFRAVLDAMARPGTLHRAGQGLTPPAPLDPATAAVLLTLVDHDTALWLDPAMAPARDWIAFHCGAGFAAAMGDAAFALALELPDLVSLSPGTHEQPETAATLILQVGSLTEGTRYRLRGPGLQATGHLSVRGLPADFVAIWHGNRAGFPLGVDLVLCAGTSLAALPRSVTVEAD
ncbi:MAG TPA: phosphonate C-P lyase system protein PhnH [Acetobacteraceae bacterium]|jgi:alpha-D-ribose 1-methylphosphonate 5-triphosphate synthase subunit PhnH|nr:phosphonate C-P lyase system protein PhnH [Acetobacteraceae bacterium]